MVPTYFVTFTSATLVTSIILAQGFAGTIIQLLSLIAGFFVIVCGITLLQLSKVDPKILAEGAALDRKSTLLLKASRSMLQHDGDGEKGSELEDPGIDALRGGFGAFGSIHRAISSRKSMRDEGMRRRNGTDAAGTIQGGGRDGLGLTKVRHQLYDAPMPSNAADKISLYSSPASPRPDESLDDYDRHGGSTGRTRGTTISFANEDDIGHNHTGRTDVFPPRKDSIDHPSSRFSAYSPDAFHGQEYEARSLSAASPTRLPRGGGGGPNLASMLSNHFAHSEQHDQGPTAASPRSRRFNVPGFGSRGVSPGGGAGHREGRIKGPRDLDMVESRSLVHSDDVDEENDDAEDEELRAEREELEREYHSRLPSRGDTL